MTAGFGLRPQKGVATMDSRDNSAISIKSCSTHKKNRVTETTVEELTPIVAVQFASTQYEQFISYGNNKCPIKTRIKYHHKNNI